MKIENGKSKKLKLRCVDFWDDGTKRVFVYITNLFELRADLIAALYKIRWQIELLFKNLNRIFHFVIFPEIMKMQLKFKIGVH
ncbi:MAG: transposase [Bacteroidales bacterium]|nr:transposase [Bacteroidales bacterium]